MSKAVFNLESEPMHEQLAALLAECDDNAGHHIVWVDVGANVHVSLLPEEATPPSFEKSQPSMKLRYETLPSGSGYVGKEASQDSTWVAQLFTTLVDCWPEAKEYPGVVYYDGILS